MGEGSRWPGRAGAVCTVLLGMFLVYVGVDMLRRPGVVDDGREDAEHPDRFVGGRGDVRRPAGVEHPPGAQEPGGPW